MSFDNPMSRDDSSGFYYEVTDNLIQEHQKRSVTEILEWIETTNEIIWKLQTEEEKKNKYYFKRKNLYPMST
ncbi:MAG: hypothetical protein HY958_11105 [Bacteroidia bacterium]|nr:hypothetical protein [Bacteroidia bacterium]